jgi:hypothetical protein
MVVCKLFNSNFFINAYNVIFYRKSIFFYKVVSAAVVCDQVIWRSNNGSHLVCTFNINGIIGEGVATPSPMNKKAVIGPLKTPERS